MTERKVVVVVTAVGFLGLLSTALGFAAEATKVKVSDVQTSLPSECIYPRSPALALGLLAALALVIAQAIVNTVAGCICCKKHQNSSDANWTVALISFIVSWGSIATRVICLQRSSCLPRELNPPEMPASLNSSRPLRLCSLLRLSWMFRSIKVPIRGTAKVTLCSFQGSLTASGLEYQAMMSWAPIVPPMTTVSVLIPLQVRVTFIIAFLMLLMGAALNDQRGAEEMYFGDYCYVVRPGVFSGGAVLSLASISLAIVYYVALSTSKNVQSCLPGSAQGIMMGRPQVPPMSTEPVFVPEDTYNRQQIP